MRLLTRQRDLLAIGALCADQSVIQLAKMLGSRQHTVRFDLEKMAAQEVIRKAWAIDVFRLGYYRFNVLFCLRLQDTMKRKAFLTALAESPATAFLGEVIGDYDYEIGLIAQNVGEIFELLLEMSERHGEVLVRKAVSLRRGLSVFPRKYLSPRRARKKIIQIGETNERVVIDELDRMILREISRAPWSSLREIGRALNKPVTTLSARMLRLRKSGVIKGAIFSTNPAAYGSQGYVLLLQARGLDRGLGRKLQDFSMQHPHCSHFVECLGGWDYEIGVEVEQQAQLVALRQELEERFGYALLSTKTLVRSVVHKYLWYPM